MILSDTGFIVGSLIASDQYHTKCVSTLKTLRVQLITTWPCVTEAMYLVHTMGGNQAVNALIDQVQSGFLILVNPDNLDALRACELMRQYADTPMDFVDASLVAAAEKLDIKQILTFDSHFYVYRIDGNRHFQVLP